METSGAPGPSSSLWLQAFLKSTKQECRLLHEADVTYNLAYTTDYEQLIRAFLNAAPVFKPAAKEQRQTRQNAYSQAFLKTNYSAMYNL